MNPQVTVLPPLILNWTTKNFGGFVGTFDAEFRPGPYIAGFHVFVSKGCVHVGPPQNERQEDLFCFLGKLALEEFTRYALLVLLSDEVFLDALRKRGINDAHKACRLTQNGDLHGQ